MSGQLAGYIANVFDGLLYFIVVGIAYAQSHYQDLSQPLADSSYSLI